MFGVRRDTRSVCSSRDSEDSEEVSVWVPPRSISVSVMTFCKRIYSTRVKNQTTKEVFYLCLLF